MDTATCRGKGFKDKGQWREANRRCQLQTAIHAGIMLTSPPPGTGVGPHSIH